MSYKFYVEAHCNGCGKKELAPLDDVPSRYELNEYLPKRWRSVDNGTFKFCKPECKKIVWDTELKKRIASVTATFTKIFDGPDDQDKKAQEAAEKEERGRSK